MSLSNKQKAYIDKNSEKKSAEKIARELNLDVALVKDYLNAGKATLPVNKTKRRLFFSAMVAIPFLFFILLETGLRVFDYRGNLDLFLFPEVFDGEIGVVNTEFTARYFFNVRTNPSPSGDTFLAQKPENGYRVFVMGGSTTNGYPYGYNATFSRMFRDMLQDAAPERHVEVVNVATSAINTFTLYDQVDEILQHEPDLILIYSGHNEYYGALGVGSSETFGAFPGFIRSYLKLQRYKTFLLLRDGIVSFTRWIGRLRGQPGVLESGTLMQRMVGQQEIPLDSDVYELGKLQFESNLNAILRKFDRADVPVFIGSLTSNLKEQTPFISRETELHPAADEVFRNARNAYRTENFGEALEGFIFAKDLDALRFRAPESFNTLIKNKTNERDGVFYVPVHERFLQTAENGIIGFDLMLEHLHPNYTGYHLMALSFWDAFAHYNTPGVEINPELLASPEEYMRRTEMTEFDKRVGDHRIKLLVNSWPFVTESDPRGYPRNYTPFSIADSVAFSMVNSNIRWDLAKVRLAEIYTARGDYDRAYREYRGLMREQPYNDSPFLRAANLFLERNMFVEARPYLEQSLQIETSAFATKMLGAIEVDAGNIDRGIELLEISRNLEPKDPQMLFNLSGAYGLNREFQKADKILNILEEVNPQFPGARSWRIQLDGHLRQLE